MTTNDDSAARECRPIGAELAAAARRLGHAPLLTFYDDATGEQTELSYATFDNWVSKAANLLSEEMDVSRGSRVALRVWQHWTAAVLAAAAWKVGAAVVLGEEATADIVIVAEDDASGVSGRLLVVGSGMGGRVAGDPPGVHFGDEVLAFGDDYDDPDVSAGDQAVVEAATVFTQADLMARTALPQAARVLSLSPLTSAAALAEVVVAPVLAGGSVVWCPAAAGADLRTRSDTERVTHRFEDGTAVSVT